MSSGKRQRAWLGGSGKAAAACRSRRGAGFTLIEVLMVMAILGILAALVLPKFSDASVNARENAMKDDLRYLRTQVIVFKAQHRDVQPGYPSGNRASAPTESDFVQQMTQSSDDLCHLGAASATYRFGPYIEQVPVNPINGKRTVTVVADSAAMPPAGMPDNSTGWIYKPQTLEIIPNSPGVDRDGVRYIDY